MTPSRTRKPGPPARKPLLRWSISRVRGARAELVGVVEAANAEAAVDAAIERFNITDRDTRKRLAAYRLS